MNYLGDFPDDHPNVDVYFNTFDSNDPSASVIVSAFVVGDIAIYKDGSVTQRSSTTGFTLLDTDGINFDGVTGVHGFSIDLSDNTDAGFFAPGSEYAIVVGPVTVDAATVNFVAATFSIERAGGALALAKGSAGFVAIDTVVDAIKVVTDKFAFTVANLVDSNVLAISGDSGAADNLEATYDGTGYTDIFAPAQQQQVDNISSGSGTINTLATGFVLTTGSENLTDYTDTHQRDGVYHALTDAAGTLDGYYELTLLGNQIPSSVKIYGRVNSANDSITVSQWDWNATTWSIRGVIFGQGSTVDSEHSFDLIGSLVGVGVDLGKIRVRVSGTGLTTATFNVDEFLLGYTASTNSVGYSLGRIWVNTLAGTAGTIAFVNGTADNPALTWADALTLSASTGLTDFQIINGSSIQLTAATQNYSISGDNWSLDLNGQDVAGSFFYGAIITGVATGASAPHFEHCEMGAVTLPPCRINGGTGFSGTLTIGSAGTFDIVGCTSLIAGSGKPTIDLGAAVGASNINIRGWNGGLTFANILAGDAISLEGEGGIITVGGSGGTLNVRGIFEDVVDNSSAAVIITQVAMLNRQSLAGYANASVWIDTNGTNSGIISYVDGTSDNPVNNIADGTTIAASVGTDGLTSFSLIKSSSITLAQTYNSWLFAGDGGSIDLGNQDIGSSTFKGVLVTGIGTGLTSLYEDCSISTLSVPLASYTRCALSGTIGMSGVGSTTFSACYSSTASVGFTLDFTAVGNVVASVLEFNGTVEVQNMTAGDVLVLVGSGTLTFNANCTGGTATLIGQFVLTDNGSVTITKSDEMNTLDDIPNTAEFEARTIPAASYFDPAADPVAVVTDVTNQVSADMTAISGDSVAADNLEASMETLVLGTATGTPTTTTMADSSLTEATNDHYNGRVILWRTGALLGQATSITGYNGTTKTFTFTEVTNAASAGDAYVVV